MDTGRAGTIFGQSMGDMLGKAFFQKHGLMPKGDYRLEALHAFPTPDFQNLGAGSYSTLKSWGIYTGSSSSRGNFGWNFGANKTKALFILGHLQGTLNRQILLLNDAEPNTNEAAGAKAFGLRSDLSATLYDLGRISSADGWNNAAGWTQLALANSVHYAPLSTIPAGLALYVDTSGGGVIKGFLRIGMDNWIEILSTTSSHLSVVRCATLLASPSGSGLGIFATPIGIYAE